MSQAKSEGFNPNDYFNSNKLNELAVPATDDKGRQIGVAAKAYRPPRVINAQQASELLRKGNIMDKPMDEIKQAELEEAKELAAKNKASNYVHVGPDAGPVPAVTYTNDPYDNYFNQRRRVTFELDGGAYSLPAIDIIEASYGVMVILPAGNNDVTFIPSPGAELAILYDDKRISCFSPGTVFNIEELKVMVISLVRRDTDE
mgnify:CR=1 FL=1